jgi:glycogen debranching enzyme
MQAEKYVGWKSSFAELLMSNRVEVNGYRYTCPAPSTYEHQWLWDSCFHAIAYRWIDAHMASDELMSLVSHQLEDGPDAGMIPHMIYWRGGGRELWQRDDRSAITQPPLIGVAALRVYAVSHNLSLLKDLYPRLCAYHAWFDRRRDLHGNDLVGLIHPWESGSDASPCWDRAMKLPAHFPQAEGTAARKALAARLTEFGQDAATLARAGSFFITTVDFNAIRAADLEALAEIAAELGKPSDAIDWQARARLVQAAVGDNLLRPFPHHLEGLEARPVLEDSASHFIALFGGCAEQEDADKLAARLQQPDYWTPFPVPTTPTSSPAFAPDQYWRGNTWIQFNWLIYNGLRRYGYYALAARLFESMAELIQRAGLREYYHPISGEGLGAHRPSAMALILDMFKTEGGIDP